MTIRKPGREKERFMTGFAERIQGILDKQGKRKSDIAHGLGIADSTVRSWWDKNSLPAADVALRVAEFLGVSLSYLVTGERAPAPPALRDVYPRLTDEQAEDVGFIADIYPDITDTDRAYIMGAARTAEKNVRREDGRRDSARDA